GPPPYSPPYGGPDAPTAPQQRHPQPAAPQGPPQASYGQVPAGGPAYGGPPLHPVGPSGDRRRGKAWVWAVLAVVLALVLGTGVTLAVVQPWDGGGSDGSAKGDDPEDPDGEDAGAATQGDVDGDGRGDAIYYVYQDYDDVKKVTARSTGEVFETTELAADPYNEPEELYFDWDGDGANDKLTWSFVGSGDQITLSSSDKEFPGEQTHTMSLSTLKEYGDIRIQVVSGDFDGDGDEDLALAGPNDKLVDVSVMLNDGKGTFAAPVLWLSIPNAVIEATTVRAGDFDADGDDDLWAELPADKLADKDYTSYYSGDRGWALLKSSGRNFELGAITKSRIYHNELLVGDVAGDGVDRVVGVDVNSYEEEIAIAVYDVSGGQLKEIPGFSGTSKVGRRNLQGATLSDVDGDGDGDVVFVVKSYEEAKFTGVQVMTSTGTSFEPAVVWAETPTCQDEKCRIEFPKVGIY
uniref:FG-GAP-like repeat-containing protein n=1 Tax=Nocardioides sp. SYSU DS0651 TaxID=3415955 RepID=UPI003F4BC4F8